MLTGLEVVGLVGTVAGLLDSAVQILDNVRTARTLAAENKPLCAALVRQLGALTKYVEGMQCAPRAELDALGPVWAGAFGQLAVDLAAVEKKLRRLASAKRHSNAVARKASELKHAGEVSAALQFAEEKLDVAWGRLQALESRKHAEATARDHADAAATRQDHVLAGIAELKDALRLRDQSGSLAVIEQVLDLEEGSLSMARVIDIVKVALVPARVVEEARVGGHGQVQGRLGAAGTAENMPGAVFDYEDERRKLEELQPRLVAFWRRLERGKTGRRMSGEERKDMAALMQLLWAPWKLDRSAVKASSGFGVLGSGTFGVVTKGTLALTCGKMNVAVKVMQGAFSDDEFKADFFREASMLHRLRHPAIVTFYGAWWPDEEVSPGSDGVSATGSDDTDADADSSSDSASSDDSGSWPEDSAAFVMERMDGHVGELVDRGKISAREDLWSIFVDSAEGLLHLHEHGVMHLDVKPENILARVACGASGHGRVGRAKLTDFGVSRRKQNSEASRATRASQRQRSTRGTESGAGLVGTLVFMAPEILLRFSRARGEAAGDAVTDVGAQGQAQRESSGAGLSFACDVYSLGMTICRVMQLHMARAGKRVALPATLLGSEGELAAAARSGALAGDVQRWVKEVLSEEAEMALRDLVLSCVQARPSDRPPMAAVLVALGEMRAWHRESSGRGNRGIERAVGLPEMSAASTLALGVAYRDGTGREKDAQKSFTLISRSADLGNVAALECLADLYATGVGVAEDSAKACELFQRAADGGNMGAVRKLGKMYVYGKGVAKDSAKARELFQRAADGGDIAAVWNLGIMYENGIGVAKDFAKARELFQRAADEGDMTAVRNLALMYCRGNGVARDFAKARELLQRAADGGDMIAVSNLGEMYENGFGVATDFEKARELYQRAADGGDMKAVSNLGVIYCNGIGVATDFAKARELFQRAADGGDMNAVRNLSVLYENGISVTTDFAKACELYQSEDFSKARELFQRAADAGDMNAARNLGLMYCHGNGVAKDFAKARELFQRAADGGDMIAARNLGLTYCHGNGVAKDFAKARELFQRAADAGDMIAVHNLGVLYENGNGVPKDFLKAYVLYQRAADGGDMEAVRSLGVMYENGNGVPTDFAMAYELYQRAADRGDMTAVSNLGVMYLKGKGVAKDFAKARKLFQRAADGGDITAVGHLGVMYENGLGVAKDFGKASELHERAATAIMLAERRS